MSHKVTLFRVENHFEYSKESRFLIKSPFSKTILFTLLSGTQKLLWNFKISWESAGNFNCQFCKDCSFSKIIIFISKISNLLPRYFKYFLNIFEKSKIEAVEWRVNELTFWWDGSPLPLTMIYQGHYWKRTILIIFVWSNF